MSLGWWALQFTPRVARLDEAVVMEVRASQRLFGGAAALHARVLHGAARWGCTQWGHASTALAALARARHGASACDAPRPRHLPIGLDQLPLHTLSATRLHQATLSRLGCKTLGDVRRLPRDGLSRRFGAPLLLALDQAHGLQPETFDWLQLPERFDARLELPGRVDTTAALVFAARRLLQQLCAWLAGRHAGVRALTLRWQLDARRRDDAQPDELLVRLSDPTRDLERLHRLLGEHLGRTLLRGPVGELSLHADDIEPLAIDSAGLFQEQGPGGQAQGLSAQPDALASPDAQRRQREALSTLLDRLSARLGPERVTQAHVLADHRPERTQRWAPAVLMLNTAKQPVPPAIADHPQPCWILPAPLPLALNKASPVSLAERPVYQGPLRLLAGPHRVEAGWWDDLTVARDYYIAHSEQAGLLWVFRERHAPGTRRSPWFLHGFFA